MVMQEAKMKWDKIDKVLLAGGMTRMPMMRAMIAGFSSVPLIDHVNPDEVVARGAAIQGILSMLNEEDVSDIIFSRAIEKKCYVDFRTTVMNYRSQNVFTNK